MRRVFSLAVAVALVAVFTLPGLATAASSGCSTISIDQNTVQFPPGFWSAGPHSYSIRIVDTYPGNEFDGTFGPYPFTDSDTAPLYTGKVQMGIGGFLVSLPQITLVPDNTINPAQGTVYQTMTFWDMTQTTVAAAKAEIADTTMYFRPDGGAWITAHAWPLTSACVALTPANQGGAFTAFFSRSWGKSPSL